MAKGRSRIDLRDVPAKSRKLPSVREDVLLIAGVTAWGPITATPVLDFDDAVEKFGWYLASYHTMFQLKLFFDNGGKMAYVSRIMHWDTGTGLPTTGAKSQYTVLSDTGVTYGAQNTFRVWGLYYGSRGNNLSVKIQAATNGEATRFDLLVYENGIYTGEWFRNLSMTTTDANYIEDVINTLAGKSVLITIDDLDGSGTAADKRPANGTYTLAGGDDGLTSLADADYIGTAAIRRGLHAFTQIEDGDILIAPDRTGTSFQNSATSYCSSEKKGKVVFIPDPPAGSDKAGIVAQVQALTASEARTAVPWPRIYVSNPDKAIYGKADTVLVAPSGCYAARMARNSTLEGKPKQFTQPGNEIYGLLDGATGVETTEVLEPTVRDYVTDYGVNPIVAGIRSSDGNYGVWVDDVQAGKRTGNFISVGEIRGVARVRKQVEAYLNMHRTQSNTEEHRLDLKATLDAYFLQWCDIGAFVSKNPDEAFYVNTDPDGESLNNPLVQDAETLRVLIGMATARSWRFGDIMFTRDNRAVESYIQQQLSSTR